MILKLVYSPLIKEIKWLRYNKVPTKSLKLHFVEKHYVWYKHTISIPIIGIKK